MGAGPLNQYTMASLLGSYIEVENPILQVLLNALLFSLIGALFTTDFKKLRKSIFEYLNLSKYWRRFWKDPTRPTMKFQGSCRQSSSNMHCVPELSAWLHHIQQLIEKIPEGGNVSFSEFELLHLQMQAIDHLMPANNQEFDVGDDIRCEFTTKQVTEQRNMKNQGMIEVELESFSLIISTTPERGLHHLLARTKEVVEKYNAYKSKKLTESPCLFVYQGGPAEKTSSWKKEKFSSTRKVEHIWIEEQHKFFAAYETFLNDREFFEARGDPWTFNALLYGPPGCGKSSLLKALVNYDLAREKVCHLIVVPVSNIKNADEFRDLMFTTSICGFDVPFEDRIYVFEDFDACEQSSVFNIRRKLQKKEVGGENLSDDESDKHFDPNQQMMQMLIEHVTNKKVESKFQKKLKRKGVDDLKEIEEEAESDDTRDMNLCTILNALDGINERTGQRCFWTTNLDPPSDHFDPAFLRPGRIDMMIRFDRAPTDGVKFLLEKHYRTEVSLETLAPIEGRHFTPAEVKQFCRQSPDAETAIHYMHMSLKKTEELSEKKMQEEEKKEQAKEMIVTPPVLRKAKSWDGGIGLKIPILRKIPSASEILEKKQVHGVAG